MENWAGSHTYAARAFLEPTSVAELQEVVRTAEFVRPLGTRHAFSDLADTPGTLIGLGRLPRRAEIDAAGRTITIDGAVRYGDLVGVLDAAGLALSNLASLPHLSVAGACATATHGSGIRLGCLSTAVEALEIVRSDGELVRLSREDDPAAFPGAVVGLGALGVVVGLRLALEPTYAVRQDVFEDLPMARFADHAEEIAGAADSVSLFTDWRSRRFHQVWLKTRVGGDRRPPADVFGARPATQALHPLPGFPADACTDQLGQPGPWHARLPHFRLDHTPSAGDELQTEYLIDRRNLVPALEALQPLAAAIARVIFVTEIRFVAADDLWLSPASRRASAAIHFTWRKDRAAVDGLMPRIEDALAPFAPRPHWGKLFVTDRVTLAARYPRMADFVALSRAFDPRGAFRNPALDRWIFGA